MLALLGKIPDRELAQRLGCTVQSVGMHRRARGIKPFGPNTRVPKWGLTELALLRGYSDKEIAKMTGRSPTGIAAKRRETI